MEAKTLSKLIKEQKKNWQHYDFIVNDYVKRGGTRKDGIQIARMAFIIKLR